MCGVYSIHLAYGAQFKYAVFPCQYVFSEAHYVHLHERTPVYLIFYVFCHVFRIRFASGSYQSLESGWCRSHTEKSVSVTIVVMHDGWNVSSPRLPEYALDEILRTDYYNMTAETKISRSQYNPLY